MKKLVTVFVFLLLLISFIFAQQEEEKELDPFNRGTAAQPLYNLKDYYPGIETYFKLMNTFYTDNDFERYLYENPNTREKYNETRNNDFKWHAFLTENLTMIKERVRTYDFEKGLFYADFYVRVSEYDFDKKGFWCGWQVAAEYFTVRGLDGLDINSPDFFMIRNSRLPDLLVYPKQFPNRYFFHLQEKEAEKLVEYFKEENRGFRYVHLFLYYKYDPVLAKSKQFSEFMLYKSGYYVLPVQTVKMELRKTGNIANELLAEIKETAVMDTSF